MFSVSSSFYDLHIYHRPIEWLFIRLDQSDTSSGIERLKGVDG
jgi:hypothetical protein